LKFKIWKVTPAPVKPVKRKRAIVYSDKEDKNIMKIEPSFLHKQTMKRQKQYHHHKQCKLWKKATIIKIEPTDYQQIKLSKEESPNMKKNL
jgi:ribosomal protein S17